MWHRRTELTEVPSRYNNVVPVPRVLWPRAHRTYRNSGNGSECHTELTEVLCRVINTAAMVLNVRYVQNTNIYIFALVVGVHVASVAFFAGKRRLVFAARGVRQGDALVFVVLLFQWDYVASSEYMNDCSREPSLL